MQRAFTLAGARASIACLWKVQDNATQALMVEFYKNLCQKKLGKLEALRQAQLAMIRGYNPETGQFRGPNLAGKKLPKAEKPGNGSTRGVLPPFYWAAFSLHGDWR